MIATLASIIVAAGVHVHDGDTIDRGKDRIRLWGIDAPELSDPSGYASRDYLSVITTGQTVICALIDRDRFGSQVMRCTLPNGADLACAMVAAGLASDWPRYSGGAYSGCEQ